MRFVVARLIKPSGRKPDESGHYEQNPARPRLWLSPREILYQKLLRFLPACYRPREIDWQSAYPVEPGGDRMTSRVDIGVFAWNGAHDSAPAFLSVQFPTHQQRGYTRTPDGIRLISIDYDAAGRGAYFDPYLYWSAPWSDRIEYGPEGEAIRTRTTPDGEITLTAPDRLSDGRTASYVVEGRGQKRTLRMKIAKGE